MNNPGSTINLEEGTLAFWVKPGKIVWNSKTQDVFIKYTDPQTKGSIVVYKDEENRLRGFFLFPGKGKGEVSVDVSALPPEKPHHIVLTWNTKGEKKQIELFVDGESVDKQQIYDIHVPTDN